MITLCQYLKAPREQARIRVEEFLSYRWADKNWSDVKLQSRALTQILQLSP